MRTLVERANDDSYPRRIAESGDLKGLHGSVPEKFTMERTCGRFCTSCVLPSDKCREVDALPATRPLPITGPGALMSRLRPAEPTAH
ncbi:hypothetical protein [Streptomyces xantholiticus]|uniref:hypothetical protein n=1 Tax=Streptomyces xantholiticus TaxID=68285 RepID=UPI001674539F|nr:hypothetical protein [Streptomyces xantholiticus]GGW73723.1 hypothetical protein GCM10010381_68060 [Streptomyces xantholiticus]